MTSEIVRSFFRLAHNLLASTSIGVTLAIKLRNQANAVISAHLSDGIDAQKNGELWLINLVAPTANVFIDVGANVGTWSVLFLGRANASCKGVLFEPSPVAIAKLSRNSMLAAADVEIVDSAVGPRPGTACLYMEPNAGETSSLVEGHSQLGAERVEVRVTTIDREMERRKFQFVDFLKIDAEGFDLHVLKGAASAITANRIGVIQFEYNMPWARAGSTLAEALAFFEERGYAVYLLRKEGFIELNYTDYGEFYAYSNFVAVLPSRLPNHRALVRRDRR